MSEVDPLQALLSADLELPDLLLRARLLLAGAYRGRPGDLSGLLPEVLVRCQSEAEDAAGVLDLVGAVARAAPGPGRSALLEALERGVAAGLQPGLVALLEELGEDRPALLARCLAGLAAGDAADRVRALTVLCALGPVTEAAAEALLLAGVEPLWHLERRRVAALARAGAPVVPALASALGHPDPAVRARAEAALEALGPAAVAAVPALLEMPSWPGTAEERGEAVAPSPALFAAGRAAVPALLAALAHPWPPARARAAAVLGARKRDDPSAVPALIAGLADPDGRVYQEAVRALVWTAPDGAVTPVPAEVLPLYLDALTDARLGVRLGAAVALALGGPEPAGLSALLEEGLAAEDEPLRRQAAWGLGALPEPPAGALARTCREPALAGAVTDRLGGRGPVLPAALEVLAAAYLDTGSEPVGAALVRAGAAGAEALLGHCRASPAEGVAERSARVFAEVGQAAGDLVVRELLGAGLGEALPAAEAGLLYALLCAAGCADEAAGVLRGNDSVHVRRAAATGLAWGTPEAATALIAALEDADAGVRRAAAESALRLWFAEGVEEDWRERFIEATLRVLARAGVPEGVDLRRVLRSQGDAGLDGVVGALERVCRQADEGERRVASELLGHLMGKGGEESVG
jgi:HEAT repeat protein